MPEKDLTKYDIRTLRRKIQKEIISKTEYEGYLKNLPDEEGNYELVALSEEISIPVRQIQSTDFNPSSMATESTSEIQSRGSQNQTENIAENPKPENSGNS